MTEKKYAIILGNLGNTCDRFCSTGYKDNPDTWTMLEAAATIDGVTGVELVGTWDISAENVDEMAVRLKSMGLACVSIIPDHFSQAVWWKGAFTSREAGVRRKAIETTFEACEFAKKLGSDLINIWNGQDGYDYPLQADYDQERTWLVEGIRECAQAYPTMRFALEYKLKEPRTHSYLARMADTLLVCQEVGTPNVGVTIDVGHSMVGYEDVAEAVVLAKRAGNKLYHMHFNDNFRAWDDDMIVGSVHTVEYIELLYWLDRTGYAGWLSMDQYPYREDGRDALAESVAWLQGFQVKVDRNFEKINALLQVGEATQTSAFLRSLFLE